MLIVCSCGCPGATLKENLNGQPVIIMIKGKKKEETSGP